MLCTLNSAICNRLHNKIMDFTGIEGQSGKIMCQGGGKPDIGKFHSSYIGMNVCDSTYENGCVVDGMYAMAAD